MTNGRDKRTLLLTQIEKNREAQIASIAFRRKILEHQRQRNYIREYDRIKGDVHKRTLLNLNIDRSKDRLAYLKRVAKISLGEETKKDSKKHEIYEKD